MKYRKIEIFSLIIILLLQSLFFVFWGEQKSYLHMDEAYSLGLANYDRVEIQANEDFYNIWHSSDYYEDYLSLQEDEKTDFRPVYENQKNDVHPPLYYLLLRIAMFWDGGHYSKWPGLIINIVLYLFITVFMYLIGKRLFRGQTHTEAKALIVAFLSAVTMSSLTNMLYIRMYTLSTLNIVLTTYLHLRLTEDEDNTGLMVLIGIVALLGSLTHYYYLFFLAGMFLLFAIRFFRENKNPLLVKYTIVMAIAGICSLIIFPHSVFHMFFGYQGQNAIHNLQNKQLFLKNLLAYWKKLHLFTFHKTLLVVLIVMCVIYLFMRYRKKHRTYSNPNAVDSRTVWVPTAVFSLAVAAASPWIELRYIMPVCGLIFLAVLYYLFIWMRTVLSEKICSVGFLIFLLLLTTAPKRLELEPEVVFKNRTRMVKMAEENRTLPALYLFNSNENRFLDDILLFSIFDESYVAKDLECTEENIQSIIRGKDCSKGFFVFINNGQENDALMEIITAATGRPGYSHVYFLNECHVYRVN